MPTLRRSSAELHVSAKFAAVLTHVADTTVKSLGTELSHTPFDAPYLPCISVSDYLERMRKHMHCSDEVFVVASVLLTRLEGVLNRAIIVPKSLHRLAFVAVVVAAKMQDDRVCANAHYAEVAGVPVRELNSLEAAFLSMISFRCVVSPEEYDICLSSLNAIHASIAALPTDPRVIAMDQLAASHPATWDTPSHAHAHAPTHMPRQHCAETVRFGSKRPRYNLSG